MKKSSKRSSYAKRLDFLHKSPPSIYQTLPRHLLEALRALAQDKKEVQEKVLRKEVHFLAQEPPRVSETRSKSF